MRARRAMWVVGLVVVGGVWLMDVQGFAATRPVLRGLRGGSWSAQVRSPRPGQVVEGRSVRVVLRVPSGVRSLRVRAGGSLVSGAFRAGRGGVRVGVLRLGRGVHYGRNTLYYSIADRHGERSYGQVSFVLAHSVPGLLTAARARPAAGAPGHAALGVSVARTGLIASVALNGRRAVRISGRRRRLRLLDGDEGLRAGQNVLQVVVLDRYRGQFARRRLRLTMSLRVPIPAAGPSRHTVVGRVVQATAGSSEAAFRGSRLSYRWQIVRAPRGSRARLTGARKLRARLRPDRPGPYVLGTG